MKLVSANITGSLVVNNIDVTEIIVSSSNWSGSLNQRVSNLESTASVLTAASGTLNTRVGFLETTASILTAASGTLNTRVGSLETTASILTQTSGTLDIRTTRLESTASILTAASGTLDTRVVSLESTASILTAASGTLNTRVVSLESTASVLTAASGTLNTRVGALESTSSILVAASASLSTASGSLNAGLVNVIATTGSFATTGSNTFTGTQYFSNIANANSFTATASFYSDGGMRVTRDMYISGTAYFNNVVVYGTQSINFLTASQLNIATNIITVNTATPTVRFGGLAVYDSGSTNLTGSILWDSEDNQWVYSNPSGSTYDSAMFLVGPRNSGALGNEVGITCNFLSKGNGMHHMTSSAIFDDGSRTCFYGNSIVTSTGVGCFSGAVCAASVASTGTITGTTMYASTVACSPVGCFTTSCASAFIGGTVSGTTMSGTTLYGSTSVCAPTVCGGTVCGTVGCFTSVCSPTHVGGTFSGTTVYGSTAICGGTVSGTTGTFSSSVLSNSLFKVNAQTGFLLRVDSDTTNVGGFSRRSYWAGNAAADPNIFAETGYGIFINVNGSSTTGLNITSGGIACFSGTVCTPSFVNAGLATTSCLLINSNTFFNSDVRLQVCGKSAYDGVVRFINCCNQGDVNHGILHLVNSLPYALGNDASLAFSTMGTDAYPHPRASIGVKTTGNQSGALVFNTRESTWEERLRISDNGIACFKCQVCAPSFISSGVSRVDSLILTRGTDPQICSAVNVGLNIDGFALYLNRYSNSSIVAGGSIIPLCNGKQDLGSANCRWCTVYTSDLSLNNGIGNYTIVEGENDLFLYNNNSCKVYKFIVQEVCPEIAPAKRSI